MIHNCKVKCFEKIRECLDFAIFEIVPINDVSFLAEIVLAKIDKFYQINIGLFKIVYFAFEVE